MSIILSILVIFKWVIRFWFRTLTQVTNGGILQEHVVVYESESVCEPIINFWPNDKLRSPYLHPWLLDLLVVPSAVATSYSARKYKVGFYIIFII